MKEKIINLFKYIVCIIRWNKKKIERKRLLFPSIFWFLEPAFVNTIVVGSDTQWAYCTGLMRRKIDPSKIFDGIRSEDRFLGPQHFLEMNLGFYSR